MCVCLFTIQSGTPLIGTRQKGVIKPIKSLGIDAESRKLRALESRGGPGLSALERSEDATKGPPRLSNARSFHD